MATRTATNTRDVARRSMGVGAVLSLAQAVGLLPWDDLFSRRWLKSNGLVSQAKLGEEVHECVVWSAVLEKLWPGEEVVRRLATAPHPGATLDRIPTKARR